MNGHPCGFGRGTEPGLQAVWRFISCLFSLLPAAQPARALALSGDAGPKSSPLGHFFASKRTKIEQMILPDSIAF